MDNQITTFTGKRVNPLAMSQDDIDIKDIAHSLAMTCRFRGHVPEFYSVAQHSVLCSVLIGTGRRATEERPATSIGAEERQERLWALLHDAAEAYLCDLPSPVKRSLRELRTPWHPETIAAARVLDRAECDILVAVATKFGLILPMPEMVVDADKIMLATELDQWMPGTRDHGALPKSFPLAIVPWPWQQAEKAFLNEFHALSGL